MSGDLITQTISNRASDTWWQTSEHQVVGRYGKLFDPKNLNNLTKEDFKSFLLIKNNLHWEGIHRQGNIITLDMKALIACLKHLLDEKILLQERFRSIFNIKGRGEYVIKGLGKAVLTPILLVVYPTKYGVWNSRSEDALKKLGIYPKFLPKDTFAQKYLKVNDVLLDLAHKYNISLWQLDGVLGEISGSGPFGSTQSEEEIVEEEVQEHGVVDLANFGMESHLEDFLVANWDKTIFGNKYKLLYKEGDLESQQYPTEIGPIDILAISKDNNEYLVIELKKGRSSDTVVGQILRYMGWVQENLTGSKKVKGAIVVLEADNKLKYSLKIPQNITLYTYQVNFKLRKEQ